MAKLLRIHLVGVGHQEAKFHPLTLSFDCDGKPLSTVLNLRNGGGKTSLLSLIYAVLLPSKHDFLGKVNGSNRLLEQYFTMDRLGAIAMEIETHFGRFGLLLAWVRREREDPLNLFSFRTDRAGIPFQELPLQGLNPSPVTSLSALISWLNERQNQAPAQVDLFTTTKFREWFAHLRTERGIDPHLYRAHLQMNKAEGAVDEEFKFIRTNDFIKRYLEFAIEPNTGTQETEDPVTASLNEHRSSLTKQPHYRKEVDFIDEIIPLLREMDGHGQRRKMAESDRNSSLSELQDYAEGIAYLEKTIRDQQAELQIELETKKAERIQAAHKRDNARRHAAGYDRRAKELKIEEAKIASDQARGTATRAEALVRLLQAAGLWRKKRNAKTHLDALVEQRRLLQQKLRPELEIVQSHALRLNAAYDAAIEAAKLTFELSDEEKGSLEKLLRQKRNELALLQEKHTELTSEHSTIAAKIEFANRTRKDLVTNRIIEPREDVAAAEERLQSEVVKHQSASAELRGKARESRKQATENRAEAGRQNGLATIAESTAAQAGCDLARFQVAVGNCADLVEIKEVLEDGDFDPFNIGIIQALRAQEQNWRDQWASLNIERAEDQRLLNRHDPQRHPLFPPPREIEDLVTQLHKRGIHGIVTAYEWLNTNVTDQNQAQDRLRKNPAIFSGLIANTMEAFEAAKREFSTFPLSLPITITLSTTLMDLVDTKSVTVVPERSGAFNAAAAVTELTGIREHQHDIDRKAQEFTSKFQGFATAANRVSQLHSEFPKTSIEGIRHTQETNQQLAQQYRRNQQEQIVKASAAEEQAVEFDAEAGISESIAANLKTHLSKVSDYRNNFGNLLEGWLAREKVLGTQIVASDQGQADTKSSITQCEDQLPTLDKRKLQAHQQLITLQVNKSNERLASYLRDTSDTVVHSDIESEEKPFRLARDTYEEKSRDGSGLQSDINAAEATLKASEAEFNAASSGIKAEEIEPLSEAPDLELQTATAKTEEVDAKAAKIAADNELERANREKPKPLGHNERADLDPELPQPTTSTEALVIRTEKQQIAAAAQEQFEGLREMTNLLENRVSAEKGRADQYSTMGVMTAPARSRELRAHPLLTGEPEKDRLRISETKDRFDLAKETLEKLIEKMARLFDNQIDSIVKDDKWDRLDLPIRDRFRKFNRTDYEGNASQYVQDCEERKAGLEAKLKEIEAIRESLVEQLYNRGNKAINSLKHAARVSTLPTDLGAWSNQPFLRVHVPTLPSQAERRVLLGRLMDSWMAPQKREMAIPQGAVLAYECLLAVVGQREIEIEILKPSGDTSNRNYRPVTELASFSGGQRVTAAILLYCVIVRVRSDQGDILTDCGFLMLDNPFGKANHFPLVDLQLKMASVMGVQLIFLTGINDFEALASFPHRVRLRNTAKNAANGERMVQHESNLVEATRLGRLQDHGNQPNS